MNIEQSIDVLTRTHLAAIRDKVRANSVEQISAPGIGKSESKREYAARLARETGDPVGYVRFILGTVSSVDVRGFMIPTKDPLTNKPKSVFSTPPWFPERDNTEVFTPDGRVYGKGEWSEPIPSIGILDLDEFGQAEDDVRKAAADLILSGEVGTTRLPRDWRVVASSNRMTDRSGVVRSLMFLVNRRCEQKIDAHMPTWLAWANRQAPERRPHYMTISFAQKNPDLVFLDAVPSGSDPFCTPRTLCLMDHDLRALRTDEDHARNTMPTDAISREVCAGWIGGGTAAQFFTHLKYSEELPDIEDVERHPDKAKLPKQRDAQMVCGYMLAHHVTPKNGEALMRYIGRLNIEMQVLAVRAVTAQGDRAASIADTRAFSEWVAKHQDLLIASKS